MAKSWTTWACENKDCQTKNSLGLTYDWLHKEASKHARETGHIVTIVQTLNVPAEGYAATNAVLENWNA